jgi:hypothetical protein
MKKTWKLPDIEVHEWLSDGQTYNSQSRIIEKADVNVLAGWRTACKVIFGNKRFFTVRQISAILELYTADLPSFPALQIRQSYREIPFSKGPRKQAFFQSTQGFVRYWPFCVRLALEFVDGKVPPEFVEFERCPNGVLPFRFSLLAFDIATIVA